MNRIKKYLILIIFILFMFGSITAGSIIDLVEAGKTDAVIKMVKKDKELLKARNARERSLIHIAAAKGHLDIVKFLVKNGADVNLEEKSYQLRPLNFASRYGHFEVVKFLLDNGADLFAREKDNETALSYAVSSSNLDIVKYLVNKGLKVNDMKSIKKVPPVYYAVVGSGENLNIVKYLISKGAKVTGKDENGWTMLHRAVWRGKKEMIDLLIAEGISPDSKSSTGITPLHNAASQGNIEAITSLLKHGADPNCIDNKGNTPLSKAVASGHTKITAILLKHKAGPNGKLKFLGVSPLHIAAAKGYGKIGTMLLKSGADHKALDDSGNTPLFHACRYKNKMMAKALLKAGAKKEDILSIFKKKNPLKKELKNGTAIIWYTGHSGWAIKTSKNLMIFDYWKRGTLSDTPSLMNGAINPEEIKDLNVSVFISHEHGDHYMPAVFDWKDKIAGINYYTGFTPKDKKGYKFLKPQKTWKLDGMEVTTIESTDTGVAFLVKVDGLVIYHSGDHANMKRDMSGKFKPTTDYLASLGLTPDLYFAPVSGCNFRDKVSLKQGVYYTIKKMKPKAVFPMHGGFNPENYIDFVKAAKEDGIKTPFHYPLAEGDWFFYKAGKVKNINKLKLIAKDVKKKKKKKCNPGCK
ncbi:MAG: ankyrin repeat domain-containing protein [Acidobacteriota bacterium]